jgi:hypothetical protein
MEEGFTLKGEQTNYLKIKLREVYDFPEKTCYWGGYDAVAELSITCGSFQVRSTFHTSTGDIFLFAEQLRKCNTKLEETAIFNSYEGNLIYSITYDNVGRVQINGEFSEDLTSENKLQFSFISDQSFMKYTLDELEQIVCKFGDLKGLAE